MAKCHITGFLELPSSPTSTPVPARGAVLKILSGLSDNEILVNIEQPITAGPDGSISFYATQGATLWIYANAKGLDRDPIRGTPFRIPETTTSDITTLQADVDIPTAVPIATLGNLTTGAQTIEGNKTFTDLVITSGLRDKGSRLFDVRAYGATIDGTTDDTTAIDAAKTAAQAAGGTVYFHIGTAIYSGSLTGVSVQGYAAGLSILKRKSGTADNVIVDLSSGNKFIKDITIDGNYAGNTGTTAPDVALGPGSWMDACEQKNVPFMMIQAVGENINIRNNRFIGPSSSSAGCLYGIWGLDSALGGPFKGMRIENNFFLGLRTGAIFLDCLGAVISGNTILRSHYQYTPTGGGMIAVRSAGASPVIVGNTIVNLVSGSDGTLASGIEMDADGATIVGNHLENCRYGVIFQAGSSGVAVGNTINNSLAKAISVSASASNCSIGPNILRGTNAVVEDSGTNTFIIGQPDTGMTSYTPTVTAGTGTFTTLGTAVGRYKRTGKVIQVSVKIPITTNGTAGDYIAVTLPFTATSLGFPANGIETVTGKQLIGFIPPSVASMNLRFYDASYPGANGNTIYASVTYEMA